MKESKTAHGTFRAWRGRPSIGVCATYDSDSSFPIHGTSFIKRNKAHRGSENIIFNFMEAKSILPQS